MMLSFTVLTLEPVFFFFFKSRIFSVILNGLILFRHIILKGLSLVVVAEIICLLFNFNISEQQNN